MKNSTDPIRNRTRAFPSAAMPQLTARPHTPMQYLYHDYLWGIRLAVTVKLHMKQCNTQDSTEVYRTIYLYTRWFKYDRDKLWLVYTQIVPVIFEPPCTTASFVQTKSVGSIGYHVCFPADNNRIFKLQWECLWASKIRRRVTNHLQCSLWKQRC
jgi:hypothetical protein